ncbi:MAG: tRNA (guanosine(46)-N7)-methyltransferase TrmB [Planctomycetes bacterium]|nr:tRNA (guanosine(46)-N7)-methyltransferase TrmB [Planctomycetota bacterium]
MSHSLSHGKPIDVGHFGLLQEDLPPPPPPGMPAPRLDLNAWFPAELRGHPLELEIGSGKGTFLVGQAAATPGVNYIGVEWARAFWSYAADRARRHALENVRLLRADAAVFVRWHCPDALFRQVHIYFPDPWPKARQQKRRIIQAEFLRELHRTLAPGGQIRIATDHADYFQWMLDHAAQVSGIFERLPFESPDSAGEGELVGTNFERKYRREGRPFHAMILRRL